MGRIPQVSLLEAQDELNRQVLEQLQALFDIHVEDEGLRKRDIAFRLGAPQAGIVRWLEDGQHITMRGLGGFAAAVGAKLSVVVEPRPWRVWLRKKKHDVETQN